MKKFIHLGIIACIALTISSCSKSANDMVINQKESKAESKKGSETESALQVQGMSPDGQSAILPFIVQPFELKLGDMTRELPTGSTGVFYVTLSGSFANDPPSAATFTLKDDNTGDEIETYTLIPSDEAESYGIVVPDKLVGQKFMFAIVDLGELYNDKAVALHSEITVNGSTSIAQFDHAFSVTFVVEPIGADL